MSPEILAVSREVRDGEMSSTNGEKQQRHNELEIKETLVKILTLTPTVIKSFE